MPTSHDPAHPTTDATDQPIRHREALLSASAKRSGDMAAKVTAAAATCAAQAASLSHDCQAMIGECRPIEAFANLIDQVSGCLRETLQLYDGIVDQPRALARLRRQRQKVASELRDPPRRLDAQGEVLDSQADDLRWLATCQAQATMARAAATDAPALSEAALAAWTARRAQLQQVMYMAPIARHVEMLACAHPPLPRPDGVAAEHTPAYFMQRLALEPLDEVATKLEAMQSVWQADIDWLVRVGTTLCDRLERAVLTQHWPQRLLDPAVDRILGMATGAAIAIPASHDAAGQAVRAVRQAGVGQATWLRDSANRAERRFRTSAVATFRLATEAQVAIWTDIRAARELAAFSRMSANQPADHRSIGADDPFRARMLAGQRLAQHLGRTMRCGADFLARASELTNLGADASEIAAWSAAVVADPGSSTNLRVFFLRRDPCRRALFDGE